MIFLLFLSFTVLLHAQPKSNYEKYREAQENQLILVKDTVNTDTVFVKEEPEIIINNYYEEQNPGEYYYPLFFYPRYNWYNPLNYDWYYNPYYIYNWYYPGYNWYNFGYYDHYHHYHIDDGIRGRDYYSPRRSYGETGTGYNQRNSRSYNYTRPSNDSRRTAHSGSYNRSSSIYTRPTNAIRRIAVDNARTGNVYNIPRRNTDYNHSQQSIYNKPLQRTYAPPARSSGNGNYSRPVQNSYNRSSGSGNYSHPVQNSYNRSSGSGNYSHPQQNSYNRSSSGGSSRSSFSGSSRRR